MKKRIYLLLLSVVSIFSACKDKSDEFFEQLFTDSQITTALNQCADTIALKTCNTLCIADTTGEEKFGYYYFDSQNYRIDLVNQIVDTLLANGYQDQVESFIFLLNRAAEQCGNRITQFWTPIIKNMTYPKPNLVLHGGNSAITEYLKTTNKSEFIATLVAYLPDQFSALKVDSTWSKLQDQYFDITGSYSPTPFGIIAPTAEQMVAGFFKKMAIEEEAIRKNPALQGNPNGLLFRVFSTL